MLRPASSRHVRRRGHRHGHPAAQRGVVMIIALIVLVAMTLGGIALVRSVYTANLIAGNLAFRESAISSGDAGVEAAAAWLLNPVACPDLGADCPAAGYSAVRGEPADGQSWDDYWIVLAAAGKTTSLTSSQGSAADVAGNSVSYVIQRLCNSLGSAQNAGCMAAPAGTSTGGDSRQNIDPLKTPSRIFYRVTSRISGPRNTVTYTQAVLAL